MERIIKKMETLLLRREYYLLYKNQNNNLCNYYCITLHYIIQYVGKFLNMF